MWENPLLYTTDIIVLKKSDIGIILKQWDNVPRKNFTSVDFTSVAFGIQIPFDNDEISAKAMCNAGQTKTESPPQNDLVQVRNSRRNAYFSYCILEPCHHLDEW